jgi:diguanylate cyclase (GGDEF)-like protein
MDEPVFSTEDRVRLLYLVGDLLEKARTHSLGGYEGGEDLFALDELLRRRLGRLSLAGAAGTFALDAIPFFIQTAPEKELLDLIELVPVAKVLGAKRSGTRVVTSENVTRIKSALNKFLEAVKSPAHFMADGRFTRDAFEIVKAAPLASLPKLADVEADLNSLLSENEPVSVILMDLDGFKAVNEKRGYTEGDKCLEAVISVTAGVIARKGKLYRFREGDEFAVILRNTTTEEAKATADRIRMAVEESNPGVDVSVTASIGVASSEESTLGSTAELLRAAEEALHVSKHTTKNCVTAWPIPKELLATVDEKRSKIAERDDKVR